MYFSRFSLNFSSENSLWVYDDTAILCVTLRIGACHALFSRQLIQRRRKCLRNAEIAYYLPLLCTQYIHTLLNVYTVIVVVIANILYKVAKTSGRHCSCNPFADGRLSSLAAHRTVYTRPKAAESHDDTFY